MRKVQQVSTQLDFLSQAIEKACSSASAFETEQYSRAMETGQALSLSVSGEADFGSSLMELDWVGALSNQALGTGIEAGFIATHNAAAQAVLKKVGIERAGKVVVKDGYYIYSEFGMAEGSKKMTTRCSASNVAKLERPAAVSKANSIIEIGPLRGNAAGVVVDGGLSFYEEYANGDPNRTDDRKLSDATVETGITVGLDLAAIGTGAAVGSVLGPPGIVVGAIVGGVCGYFYNVNVLHAEDDNGHTVADQWKDAFFDLTHTAPQDIEFESQYGDVMPGVSQYGN